jgi:hypothetical protein
VDRGPDGCDEPLRSIALRSLDQSR